MNMFDMIVQLTLGLELFGTLSALMWSGICMHPGKMCSQLFMCEEQRLTFLTSVSSLPRLSRVFHGFMCL